MDAQTLQKLINNIANRQTDIYDVVYLYGSEQGIKSTLDAIIEKCRGKRIIRTDGVAFLEETLQNAFDRKVRVPDCDLYILENIEIIAGSEANEQCLYGILDWLLEHGRQIIISGTISVNDLIAFEPRIRAQIDGGLSFYIG